MKFRSVVGLPAQAVRYRVLSRERRSIIKLLVISTTRACLFLVIWTAAACSAEILTGSVHDEKGIPVARSHITVYSVDGLTYSTNSTGKGAFLFRNLPTRMYNLT